MDRILEFHRLIDGIFKKHGTSPRVWLNPWAMPEHTLDELNEGLPSQVDYVTKDNPGAIHFNGTRGFA